MWNFHWEFISHPPVVRPVLELGCTFLDFALPSGMLPHRIVGKGIFRSFCRFGPPDGIAFLGAPLPPSSCVPLTVYIVVRPLFALPMAYDRCSECALLGVGIAPPLVFNGSLPPPNGFFFRPLQVACFFFLLPRRCLLPAEVCDLPAFNTGFRHHASVGFRRNHFMWLWLLSLLVSVPSRWLCGAVPGLPRRYYTPFRSVPRTSVTELAHTSFFFLSICPRILQTLPPSSGR